MNEPNLYDDTHTFDVQSTNFVDGMVVTAEDLDVAMRYPVDLMQTLIRAYFGCGVVCGLRVRREPPDTAKDTYCIVIEPGVALDCHGHPLRLCSEVKIDLSPNPCCKERPEKVCIAIRRDTVPEGSRNDAGGCGCNGSSDRVLDPCQHRRMREAVRVKVFLPDELKDACRRPADQLDPAVTVDPCECRLGCPGCGCCGESWVLLACVEIGPCGVIFVDHLERKFVKPIECDCRVSDLTLTLAARTQAVTEEASRKNDRQQTVSATQISQQIGTQQQAGTGTGAGASTQTGPSTTNG